MNGESKGARVASGNLKMRCILKRLTEPTGESSALWHTTLLAKSIPNKTVRTGGAGNGSRKDQGLHMKVDTTAIEQEIAAYEKQLRQHYSTKSRLMEEIDSLDPETGTLSPGNLTLTTAFIRCTIKSKRWKMD